MLGESTKWSSAGCLQELFVQSVVVLFQWSTQGRCQGSSWEISERKLLIHPSIHPFIHSFMLEGLIEHLTCAWLHCVCSTDSNEHIISSRHSGASLACHRQGFQQSLAAPVLLFNIIVTTTTHFPKKLGLRTANTARVCKQVSQVRFFQTSKQTNRRGYMFNVKSFSI